MAYIGSMKFRKLNYWIKKSSVKLYTYVCACMCATHIHTEYVFQLRMMQCL